jgi:hypothetical protein
MSSKNKRQRKSNVNLFFNQQINIFPEDFFSTYDTKSENKNSNSNTNIEKTKAAIPHPKIINLMKSKEQLKTSSHDNSRNINKDNEEISKSNNVKINVERIDNNCNTDFSFQAPPPPEKKKKIFSNKNHSMSVINKKSSVKPLFRSPLNKKMSNETTEKKSQNKNDKIININNNNTKRKNKINSHNIKCKELFQETKLKFLRDNNDKNIALFKQKEKDKYLSKYSNRNENTQNNYKNYRL